MLKSFGISLIGKPCECLGTGNFIILKNIIGTRTKYPIAAIIVE